MRESKGSILGDDRVWYDQFTSTDWVADSIADAHRVKDLRSRTDIRGRVLAFLDGAQGWILSALVGFITATIAYLVDISEAPVFDWKEGYCSTGFFISEKVSWYRAFFLARYQGFVVYFPFQKVIYKKLPLQKDGQTIAFIQIFTQLDFLTST